MDKDNALDYSEVCMLWLTKFSTPAPVEKAHGKPHGPPKEAQMSKEENHQANKKGALMTKKEAPKKQVATSSEYRARNGADDDADEENEEEEESRSEIDDTDAKDKDEEDEDEDEDKDGEEEEELTLGKNF